MRDEDFFFQRHLGAAPVMAILRGHGRTWSIRASSRSATAHLERSDRPGLGIDIDEDAVRAADAHSRPWRTPVWRHADGSFAEW